MIGARTTKATSAAQPFRRIPTSATARNRASTAMTKLKASASVRTGFRIATSLLDHVDRGVHHDPHYVHEVPVDPWDLDAEVIVGRRPVVAAYRADKRDAEQGQPEEDVTPVQPGEAEEGGSERQVVRAEPDPRVLARLDQEKGEAEPECDRETGDQPRAVVPLDGLERPVHCEARRHEDDRVQKGEVDRKLVRMRRPLLVRHRDAREEVGREERPEEHDLRGDEEVDAEEPRVDPRAAVGDWRMRSVGFGVGAHATADSSAASASRCVTTTWVTGRSKDLIRPRTSRRSHPDVASGNVETMISSTFSSWIAFSTAMTGSGSTRWPDASIPAWDMSEQTLLSLRSAPTASAGMRSVKSAGPAAARSWIASRSG